MVMPQQLSVSSACKILALTTSINSYPDCLCEKHLDHVLHPARQRQLFHLFLVPDDSVNLQPAQEL